MGKGDKKTAKGKRSAGSHGNARPSRVTRTGAGKTVAKTPAKKVATKAPAKKAAARKG